MKLTEKQLRKIIKEELSSIQNEFKEPCKLNFEKAVDAMKRLIKFHDEDKLFQELRDVVDGNKPLI